METLDKLYEALEKEDLTEAAIKYVRKRIVRGAEKSKNRKLYRKNRSKMKRYQRKYKKSAKGRRRQRMSSMLHTRKKPRKRYRRVMRM